MCSSLRSPTPPGHYWQSPAARPRCPLQQRRRILGRANRVVLARRLGQGDERQRARRVLPHPKAAAVASGGCQRRRPEPHHQHRVGEWSHPTQYGHLLVLVVEGGGAHAHSPPRQGVGVGSHHGERHSARPVRLEHDGLRAQRPELTGRNRKWCSDGTDRHAQRHGRCGDLSRLGGRCLRHRCGRARRWWLVDHH